MNFDILNIIVRVFNTIIRIKELSKSVDKKSVTLEIKKQLPISIDIKHSQLLYSPRSFEEHEIIFSIANNQADQKSIKMIDWGIGSFNNKSTVKTSFKFPYLIPLEGILFKGLIHDINIPILNFEMLSNWQKYRVIKSLRFEIELMDNKRYHKSIPPNLKLALFRMYASKSSFIWFYELNMT